MKRFLLCATLAISLLCASCAGGHGCEFESKWSYSGDEHWKSCSYSGCPESAARAAHSFGDPVTVKEPTEQAEGKAVSVCSVCLYERVTVLPALKHVHSLPESMTCDSREHWYTCSSCGERVDRAAHGRSEESVISEPTNDIPGEVRYICPDCGYSYTEELPPLPRTLTEAEWREAFVLDNMRIEHVFHMGSIPQKELFEVDEIADLVKKAAANASVSESEDELEFLTGAVYYSISNRSVVVEKRVRADLECLIWKISAL